MDYKKVPQQINDVVGDNVKKLAQLFPSAVKDEKIAHLEYCLNKLQYKNYGYKED